MVTLTQQQVDALVKELRRRAESGELAEQAGKVAKAVKDLREERHLTDEQLRRRAII